MMYEPRGQKPISRPKFVRRLLVHLAISLFLIFTSLLVGMAGYHHFENLSWYDAFLNAAMLLGGMGPVESPHTDGGRIFAGLFALYAGLLFLVATGLIVAPALHRMMHQFHWEDEEQKSRK